MESAGPMTRSRARSGTSGMPGSAAPSTRKKAAPRSTRKSMPANMPPASPPKAASNVQDVPVEDADDTAAAVDVPESSAQADKAAPTPAGAEAAPEPQGTPAPPGTVAIGGLTPLDQSGGTPGAAFGPSPVVPIKLDCLWTPGMAQQNSASPYAGFSPLVATENPAAAGGEQGDLAPDSSGVDLASMFISTPAAAHGSTSPIAGVVAAGEAPASAAPATAATATKQQQQLTPSAFDSVLMGSPAPTEAFAFSELTAAATADPTACSPAALPAGGQGSGSSDGPQPSAPLLPHAGTPGTPGWSVDTELPPAGSPSLETLPGGTPAAGVTPGSVRGGLRSTTKTPGGGTAAKRTPVAKSTPGLSPMADSSPMPPAGPPDLSDMESPLPHAMSPMMQEDETDMLPPAASPMPETDDEESLPPAGSPMLSLAGTPAAATAAKTPLSVQRGSGSTPAAAAAVAAETAAAAMEEDAEMGECAMPQEAFEDVILQTVEAQADMLQQQVQAIPAESGSTEREEVSAGEMGEGHDEQQQDEESGDCMMGSEGGEGDFSMDADVAANSAAMEVTFGSPAGPVAAGGSPTAGFFPAAVTATPQNTPAAAAVTSPGARYRSSSAKTAAPPKSALAKPKSAGSSAAPKHAHVVVPDAASPKTTPPAKTAAGRIAPGSAAARFTDGQKQQAGGSPGHTPFPSKAKVRAATAAAGAAAASRSAAAPAAAAAAAAAPKGPSHKKEMARAAAHSALKRYSKSVAAEAEGPDAGTPSPTAGSSVRRGSTSPSPTIPNVSSRLMQPTAASSAKARYSGASEQPDSVMWSPPSGHETAAAAAAGSSRPRLASKIVVPSPAAPAAGDVSLKALKRSIKSKVAEKAHATLKEGHADTLGADAVRSSKLVGGSSKAAKASHKAAAAAAEDDLDLDTYEEYDEGEYCEEDAYGGEVDELADTLAGLSVKPVNVAPLEGPLKGVAAPVGHHFKFDDSGNVQETPMSRQRRVPTHTKFDDDGNPIQAQKSAPRWR